jgi:hypothetical protein
MARKGGTMGRSGKVAPNPKYTFATDEEVGNRDMTTYQPTPTNFRQIGPEGRGGNPNEPDRRHIGGSSPSKFDDIP